MASGELDFIEPTKNGQHKKERFEVTAEEVAELRTLIAKVATEIYSLAFFNDGIKDGAKNTGGVASEAGDVSSAGCGEKDCEYCALSKYLKRSM